VTIDYPCLKKATKSINVVPTEFAQYFQDVTVDYPCLKETATSTNTILACYKYKSIPISFTKSW
jgi:hypothetical protein